MKIFVTGASGQLGHDVCRALAREGIDCRGTSSRELDITDARAVHAALETYAPDAVIHCAAWTKVDAAEDEPAACLRVNAEGTAHVAEACRALGCRLVYVSTDYVFSGAGTAPHRPEDPTGPLNAYGRSKLAGELAVRERLERYFIVRTSWVFGAQGGNFIKTVLRLSETRDELAVVADQVGGPTYTADLAALLCRMAQTDKYGVYHAANQGYCSWAELARETFRLAGRTTRVREVSTAAFGAKAERPLNSRLDTDGLAAAGFEALPPWRDALERYLRELGVI